MRFLRGKTGQGMLEYVLVLTMVLVAILATIGSFQTSYETNVLDVAKEQIESAGDRFKVK